MSEFDRIARFFVPLTGGAPEAAGLLDDAAFIRPNMGETWVITTDAISEGIHYLSGTSPDLIARKLLRSNLSDLAAKGAAPKFYTLNIMLPKHIDDAWVARFAAGLAEDQQRFGITLIGGDSIAVIGETASFSITAFGVAAHDAVLKRSGARGGDIVCVSGIMGEAVLGLKIAQGAQVVGLNQEQYQYYKARYELPEPRLELGQMLLGKATACMDISDGLVQDASHVAKASGKKLVLEMSKIPVATGIKPEDAQTGGDDYELLFTLAEGNLPALVAEAQALNIPITVIGYVEIGQGVEVRDSAGAPMHFNKRGWQH